MGVGQIDVPSLYVLAAFIDHNSRAKIDYMYNHGHAVLFIYNTIIIQPTAPRDLCNTFRILEDGAIVAGGCGAEHPQVPLVSGNVRANLIFGGIVDG